MDRIRRGARQQQADHGPESRRRDAPALWQDALAGSEPSSHHAPAGADARSAMSTTELAWFKSSYSGGGGGNCVEIAFGPENVFVRDSKDTQRNALAVSSYAWSAFTELVSAS